MWWGLWWVWGAAAVGLVILEILAPAYIFLGFGIGAALMAAIFGFDLPFAQTMAENPSWAAVGFAVLSLISWIFLRMVLGPARDKSRTFKDDINDH